MVLLAGTQLVSRGVANEFVSFIEMCKRAACLKELKVLQLKNTNIVNINILIASDITSLNVTTYEQSTTKDY
jgi:hypothetical protein